MTERAALYLRLSREDRELDISESITNQRMLLMQYADVHGIRVDAVFSDDGVSGTRWDREGLHALLRAIEDGWITTVIVKDLSRLSRDYIRTGELLEQWFPSHGVRLISVGDALDTAAPSPAMDFSPFRAVMDDWCARDVSRKVRSAIYARQRAGICTAAALPYGYERCGDTICAVHTDVIRSIFNDYANGSSCLQIAKQLTENRIPPPRSALRWNDGTVRNILRNSAYIGLLRLHIIQKISYKCSRRIRLPESESVVYPVPPIIAQEQFLRVQMILQSRSHHRAQPHWAAGKIRCGCCGARFLFQREHDRIRLICGGRKRGNDCRNPSVLLKPMLDAVADALTADGIPQGRAILSQIVEKIVLFPDAAEVYFRCARAAESACDLQQNGGVCVN